MSSVKYSHSRIECFKQCKRKFKFRYIDKLETLPNNDPQNPLIVGTALHHGIETNVNEAIKEYYMSYPIINTLHVYEAIKLEYWINNVKQLINNGNKITFEFEINHSVFHGFIDLLELLPDGTYAIYDFKYSNNIEHYMESPQLHLYKYFFEKQTGFKVSKLGFIFIPKVMIRQKKTETEVQFIYRLKKELKKKEIIVKEVKYEEEHVNDFKQRIIDILSEQEFEKTESKLCQWCEYRELCIENNSLNILGGNLEMLPSTERVDLRKVSKKKIWLYGAAYSGKTTFADQSPTPLNLNTDGNVKFVSMPRLPIKDEITMNGRVKDVKLAWTVFKEAIDDLEKGSGFETIVVDLLEDTYQYARLYMYDKLEITHESDDSFRAWDKVDIEFQSTLKRLLNLDYNIILISHEDTTKDFTKKSGDKISSIRPNIKEKLANKIAGMVDITARVVVEDDGTRYLNFKQDETIFGGGRLKGIKSDKCELSWEALMEVYNQANYSVLSIDTKNNETTSVNEHDTERSTEMVTETVTETVNENVTVENESVRKTRTRKSR